MQETSSPENSDISGNLAGKRETMISELSEFIVSTREKLEAISKRLNLTQDLIENTPAVEMGVCRVNPTVHNRIPIDKVERHSDMCSLVQKFRITRDEAKKLLEVQPYYENDSIKLDDEKIRQLLSDAWQNQKLPAEPSVDLNNLTAAEKSIIDGYVLSLYEDKIARVEIDESLSLTAKQILKRTQTEPQSESEKRQMERDSKRRRQTYRAKNVHITQKSYTEIIREVLANQMEILAPPADEKEEVKSESLEEDDARRRHREELHKHSSRNKRSRSRSRDRRSRSRSRGRRSRSRSRDRRSERRSRSPSGSRRHRHHGKHKHKKKHRHNDN
ncbi:U11/U12 small nuclear ribonucleoprotein 48 kDa protein-like [Tubulanus polymorphus]|uniref:U11/U12 small nuclear ribonucleoprotein 48 kDa protein-like n=1 Tax=Tubulanus polymorphus TaxID=672921 RepID=UPI003DA3173C